MEDLGEDVQTLTQQCHGPPTEAHETHTPETSKQVKDSTITCSTPQRVGARGMPSLDESPVLFKPK